MDIFLSWQFLLFSLAIYAVVRVVRSTVEHFFPNFVEKTVWRNLILKIMPLCIGLVLGAVATKYAYPEGITTLSSRLTFALAAGLVAPLGYDLIRDNFTKNKS